LNHPREPSSAQRAASLRLLQRRAPLPKSRVVWDIRWSLDRLVLASIPSSARRMHRITALVARR